MIRLLTPEDATAYRALRLLALQTDPDAYFSTFEEANKLSHFAFENDLRVTVSPFGYYGYFENELLAYISLQRPYFEKQQHTADVFNLYVHPSARKKGIGRSLIQHLITQAKNTPTLESLFLSVMDGNIPALTLYSSFGFKAYGNKEHSLKNGMRYVNEIYMRLDLNT